MSHYGQGAQSKYTHLGLRYSPSPRLPLLRHLIPREMRGEVLTEESQRHDGMVFGIVNRGSGGVVGDELRQHSLMRA